MTLCTCTNVFDVSLCSVVFQHQCVTCTSSCAHGIACKRCLLVGVCRQAYASVLTVLAVDRLAVDTMISGMFCTIANASLAFTAEH